MDQISIDYKEYLKSFVIGSSIFVCIFPFLYLGTPHITHGPLQGIHFEHIIIYLPILFGLVNVLMVHFMPKITGYPSNSFENAFITGALTGFGMSLVGRYKYNIPKQLFKNISDPSHVHLYATALYSFVFSVIVRNLNSFI